MAVLVYARYAGWENYVRGVRIDVFTSVLRLHCNPDELFGIWGIPYEEPSESSENLQEAPFQSLLIGTGLS